MQQLDPTVIHHIRFYQTYVPNRYGKLKPGFQLVVPIGLTDFVNKVKALPGVDHYYSWASHMRYISISNPEKLPWLKSQLEKLREEYENEHPEVAISIMEPVESSTLTPEAFGLKDSKYTGSIEVDDGNFEFMFVDGLWAGFKKLTDKDIELPLHPANIGSPGGILLNYSSSKAFRTCPWQYFALNVARLPSYPTMATHIGWSVHGAAEFMHRKLLGQPGANTTPIPPLNLEEALKVYYEHFGKVSGEDLMPPATEAEMEFARYQGENMVRNYFDFLLNDEYSDLVKYLFVEQRMKFPVEKKIFGGDDTSPVTYHGVPIYIAGTADLVYQVDPPAGMTLPEGTIGITLADLKTSVRGLDRLAHVDLMQHLGQLSLYSMMVERAFYKEHGVKAKVLYVEIRNVTPFDGVRSLRVGFWKHSSVSGSDMKQSALNLNRDIIEAFLSGNFYRTPGFHCTDCPATTPCFLSSGLDLDFFTVIHTEPLHIREDAEIAKRQRPGN